MTAASGTESGQNTPLQECQREVEALRTALVVAREHAKVAEVRMQGLETANQASQQREHEVQRSYRLLEAMATAANALSTRCFADTARVALFYAAVNTALQILGESLETDRVAVIENFDVPSARLPYWRILYEWDAPHTPSQLLHPDATQGRYEDLEEWCEQFSQGQGISALLEEMPELLRIDMAKVGVKATHLVPIFVEGQWWGVVEFDDCRKAKRWTLTKLSVLKLAADGIGSAIQRKRTQEAMLEVEQVRTRNATERLAELERLNAELQQTLEHEVQLRAHLTESEERFRTLFELSSEGFYCTEVDPPCPISLPLEAQCDLLYQNIRVVKVNPAFAAMYGVDNPDDLIGLRNADVHVADSEKNAAFVRGMVKNGYRFRNLETEEIDRQGRLRYFLNSGVSTIRDGCVVGAWATQVDITALRETQEALLQAEQRRTSELAKVNESLRGILDKLANERNLDAFLKHILRSAIHTLDGAIAQIFLYNPDAETLQASVGIDLQGEFLPAPGLMQELAISQPFPANLTGIWQRLLTQRATICLDLERDAADFWSGMIEWHQQRGHIGIVCVAMLMGEQPLGMVGLAFRSQSEFTASELEFVQAVGQQATLAIQLTRLAEEAKQAAILEERNRFARDIHDTPTAALLTLWVKGSRCGALLIGRNVD